MVDITGTSKERHDKTIRRKDRLAGYFFSLSQISFTTMVVGTFAATVFGEFSFSNVSIFLTGILSTIFFAFLGNRILIY